jgi:Transglutaminase-like superfamily
MGCGVLEESRGKAVVVGPNLARPGPVLHSGLSRSWPVLLGRRAGAGDENPSSGWRFRKQVTVIVQDETARVLDTRLGKFYALEAIGTRMLFGTLRAGCESMARSLAADYEVSVEQVCEDWAELVDGFHKAGLTEVVTQRTKVFAPAGPWAVWTWLTLAWLSFRLLGWERTVRIWGGRFRPRTSPGAQDPSSALTTTDRIIRRIASRHPLNPQCKERALVGWCILRRKGLPAKLFMGVMLYPFTAHAWTECQGRIVADDLARCEQFVAVAVHE